MRVKLTTATVLRTCALLACLTVALLGLGHPRTASAEGEPGAGLAPYQSREEVTGSLSIVGSETFAALLHRWAQEFQRLHPQANIAIHSDGSSAAPIALAEGGAVIGAMSRLMTPEENRLFEARHGYAPAAVTVAGDAIAVFVHKDNPIEGLTIPQLDAIFSSTRKCGYPQSLRTWSELGVAGELAAEPLRAIDRTSGSGTREHFREHALCGGEFADEVAEQPSSASIVEAVGAAAAAIGYASFAHATPRVRAVPLARKGMESIDIGRWLIESHGIPTPDTEFVEPTPHNVRSGRYPLARQLYLYVARPPGKPLAALTREFMTMVLSSNGQAQAESAGFVPIPASIARQGLAAIAIGVGR